jgi:hypothetical protein
LPAPPQEAQVGIAEESRCQPSGACSRRAGAIAQSNFQSSGTKLSGLTGRRQHFQSKFFAISVTQRQHPRLFVKYTRGIFAGSGDWMTATWADNAKVYLLTTQSDEAKLKEYL